MNISKKLSSLLGLSLTFFLLSITLGSWALASPIAASPDDDFHLASIWCSGDGYPGMCESADLPTERMVARSLIESQCYAHEVEISAGCQTELNVLHDNTLKQSSRGNFNGGYPPLYYSFMHLFVSENVEVSALSMRLVNICIFSILALLIWLFSPSKFRRIQYMPWLITSIPLGIFVIASNNPSSWGITGIGMGALSLYVLSSTQNMPRKNRYFLTAVYLVSTLIASGARGDSALFMVLASTFILFVSFSNWSQLFRLLPPVLLSALISLFFYFTSTQSTSVASTGFGLATDERSFFSVFTINLLTLPDLFIGIFGVWGLGWLDTSMPQLVWVTLCFIYVSYAAIAWQKMSKRQLLAQVALLAILVTLPLYILQKSMAHVGEFLQPRYLLPLYLLLAILLVEILQSRRSIESSFFKIAVWLGLSGAQAIALYMNIDRYVHGLGIPTGLNLNKSIEWWWPGIPLGPMQVFIIGSLAFTVLSYMLIRPLGNEVINLASKIEVKN